MITLKGGHQILGRTLTPNPDAPKHQPLTAKLSPVAGVVHRTNRHDRSHDDPDRNPISQSASSVRSLQHRVTPIAQVDPNLIQKSNNRSFKRVGNSALNVFEDKSPLDAAKEAATRRRISPQDKNTAKNIIAAHINQLSKGTMKPNFNQIGNDDQPLFKVCVQKCFHIFHFKKAPIYLKPNQRKKYSQKV